MNGELVHIKFTNHPDTNLWIHDYPQSRRLPVVHALGLYTRILQPCTYLDPRQKDAETISDILLRAASEPEFRNQLVKEPTKILEQYNISPEAKLIIRKSIVDLTQ